MNIFNKIALQGLKKNRTRTFVTVIGVVLSAALFTAVATFGTSLLHYLITGSIAKCGSWYVNFVDVDSSFMKKQIHNSDVTDTVSFENIGYAVLDGAKSKQKPYLFLAGFNDKAFHKLPVNLISGRLPKNSTEVLIPNHVSMKAGVQIPIGQTLTLAVGNREAGDRTLTQHNPYTDEETLASTVTKTYTVVGTYERAGFEEHSAPGYTLITKNEAGNDSTKYSLFVTLHNPHKVRKYIKNAAHANAYVLNEDVLRFYGVSDNRLFNTMMFTFGGVLCAIIMVGSVFLIYNSFNISLNERTHQFGILMSVGATTKQLRNSVLFEGLCIGILGIPIGILVGIGGVALTLPIVARNFSTIVNSNIPLVLSVSAPALLAAAAASLITILISAYIPARKAAGIPVMECIRQTNEIKTEEKAVKVSKSAQRIYGLEGTLALKNFRRNKRRYRSVVLSLTLSVVLFVSGSSFGGTLKNIIGHLTVEMDGDISFYTDEMQQNEFDDLYKNLKTVKGVYKSTYQADLIYPCTTDNLPSDFVNTYHREMGGKSAGQALKFPMYVQFIEDDIYYDFIESLKLPKEEYSGSNGKVLGIVINTGKHKTYFTGKSINFTLTSKDGKQKKTICTSMVDSYPLDTLPVESMPKYFFMVVAPWQMKSGFDTLDANAKLGLTFWSHTPEQTIAQMQSEITNEKVNCNYNLINLSSAVELFRSLTFVVDVFTYAFVIMISLIATANVFNTISTNIKLRRRELAMLRSIGMSERGFTRMMNFECFFYGIQTLLFGVPIAGIFSWLIYKGMMSAERLEKLTYQFPWKSMGISILGVFGIVFVTMLYAIDKIKKENIMDALRDDMN